MASLTTLPRELHLLLALHLPHASTLSLSATCRRLSTSLSPTVLHTLTLRTPPCLPRFLQTLVSHPDKQHHIRRLRLDLSPGTDLALSPAASTSAITLIASTARTLGFPSEHKIFTTAAAGPEEVAGAVLLLSLCLLYALEPGGLEFGLEYRPLQKSVELATTDVALPVPVPGLQALTRARLGALLTDGYGNVEQAEQLQSAVAWFSLPALEWLRLERMADVNFDENLHVFLEDLEQRVVPVVTSSSTAAAAAAVGESHVRHLLLRDCSVSDKSWRVLLALPSALDTLLWEWEAWGLDDARTRLQAFGSALTLQQKSLRTLGIFTDPSGFNAVEERCFDNGLEPGEWIMDCLGEVLKGFPELRTLSIPLYMMQGFAPWELEESTRLELVEQLPEGLEDFALDLWGIRIDGDDLEFQLVDVVERLSTLKRLLVYGVVAGGVNGVEWVLLRDVCETRGVELRLSERRASYFWPEWEEGVEVGELREGVWDWLGRWRERVGEGGREGGGG